MIFFNNLKKYVTTVSSLFKLATHSDIIGRVSVEHTEIIEARNLLVQKVEEEFPNYTHILFVDSDMTFSTEDYETIMQAHVGISSGIAVKRLSDKSPPAYLPLSGDPTDHVPLIKSLQRVPAVPIPVKGVGMAFTLVAKQVFDAVGRESTTNPGKREWFWTEHVIDEDSHKEFHLSEDYAFCRRAREFGFDIILHPSVMIGHLDTVPLSIKDWLNANNIKYEEN